jgi:hypothetical protein
MKRHQIEESTVALALKSPGQIDTVRSGRAVTNPTGAR